MSTQIKRLYQSSTEFVPITLQEAVVVNTSSIPGLTSLGITTLDKVLRTTMGVIGTNASDINTLKTTRLNNSVNLQFFIFKIIARNKKVNIQITNIFTLFSI